MEREVTLLNFGRWRTRRFGGGRMASTAMRIGEALILVGGILIIVFALIGSLGSIALSDFLRGVPRAYAFGSGLALGIGLLVNLVAGVIAIIGSRRAYSLIWAVVLLIVGLFVGGWGGLLVLIGAIIAIVARYV